VQNILGRTYTEFQLGMDKKIRWAYRLVNRITYRR
jgi:hypothetical protein